MPEPTEPAFSAWRAQVEADLGGEPISSLARVDDDGIAHGPLHLEAAGAELPWRPEARWDLRREHRVDAIEACRDAILEDLAGGASSIALRPGAAPIELEPLLEGVHLEMITLDLPGSCLPALNRLWERRGTPERRAWIDSEESDVDDALAPGLRFPLAAPADASPVAAVASLVGAGIDRLERSTATLDSIAFRLPCSSRFFTGIASIRALRLLWAGVTRRLVGTERSAVIELRPTPIEGDAAARMLHNSVVTFAGAVGGADVITGSPFDSSELAARLDRNTQQILFEEASLGAVVDPACGSGYLEMLTREIADRAWQQVRR